MKKNTRFILLPLIFALAIMAAFVLTAPVYAQDEVPTEPVPEEEPVVEEVPAEELAPVLEGAAEAGVTLVDEGGEPLPLTEVDTAEVLAGGDPWYKVGTKKYMFVLSPATCPDPLPAGVVYCQASTKPIEAAINYIPTSGLPSDGMIYIEAGSYVDYPNVNGLGDPLYNRLKGLIGTVVDGAPQVILNGGNIYVNNVDLGFTIKGFNINAQANDPFAGIYIMDSTGAVKIEDVTVRNAGTGPGIKIVNHNGAVTLTRVKSNNNPNGGAFIDNYPGTTGVTITNSSFDYNDAHASLMVSGLTIFTKGAVSIDGITSSHNTGSWPGLFVLGPGALTVKNSVFNENSNWAIANHEGYLPVGAITLSNVYAINNYAGLSLSTKGNISLTGVHADDNTYQGATLNTCFESGTCTWLGTGKVTIKDSTFDYNDSSAYGLYVQARGAIALTNVSASNNDNTAATDGARLYAHYSQLASPVTITNGTFSGNGNNGLVVYTKGTITLTKVKAVDNLNGLGADLNNTYDTVASAVNVNGSVYSDNDFSGNGSTGLKIQSNGAVSVKYADANENGGTGLYIDNMFGTGAISVSKGSFGWWLGGNDDGGIALYTKGNVTIIDVSGTGYSSDGIHLYTDSHVNSIKINNGSFYFNGLNGVDIENGGSVTLTNIQSYYNQNLGAEIASWGNILIKDSSFDYNGNHPYDEGLDVFTQNGTITLVNVSASYSSGIGAYLRNQLASSPKAVSITGGNFNNNDWTGLKVLSKGAITLKNVNAYENNETNIDIVQPIDRWVREVIDATETDSITFTPTNATLNISVSIVDTDFVGEIWLTGCTATTTHYWDDDYNGYIGHSYSDLVPGQVCTLHVRDYYASSGGAYEVAFYDTGGPMIDVTEETYGADLDNTYGTTAGITIINTPIPASDGPLPYYRDFTMNVAGGLRLHTNGAVVLSNLVLDDNGGAGVFVSNEDGGATYATNVTLSNIYANENYLGGIDIFNKGNIVMTNVASWGHMTAGQGYGATMNNTAGTGSVTIKNTIAMPFGFDYNHERGLNIFTNGTVTLTNVNMLNNQEEGIRVWQELNKGVTMTNCRVDGNVETGIVIMTIGPVTISGGHANDNGGYGVMVDNDYAADALPKPVAIKNFTASGNSGYGIFVSSKGAIALSSVTVEDTVGANLAGILLDNHFLNAGISLTNVEANDNIFVGINLLTNGPLTYKGGDVKFNGSNGVQLNESVAYMAKAVNLSNLYIYDNNGYGMEVINQGPITLTNVRANSNNAGYGMWLDNTSCGTATPCNVSILQSGTGVNEFTYNDGGGGLYLQTYGAVVMNKVAANSNEGYGVSIQNNGASDLKPANVTVTGGTFNSNKSGTGLYVRSRGIITVNGVEASGNLDGYHGADIDNRTDTSGNKGISVIKSKFIDNTYSGLYLRTYGAVVLNTVEASENDSAGADINNNNGLGKPVTVLATYGANKFIHNFNDNIVIVSNGSVALTNVTGNQSRANDGIDIDNDSGTGTITLTNVTANYNDNNGFNLYTKGNVTIRGITAMFNYGLGGNYSGLYINTNNVATAKVSITAGMIISNGDYGIQLDMFTPVIGPYLYTLSGVFYFGNNSDGAGGELNLWVY